MDKKFSKFLVITLIISTLIFPSALSVTGDVSIIASRISEITEISVITGPESNKPNTTLFGINVTVEILNRDDENQTVVECADCYPKVCINASFVNQSLEMSPIAMCMNSVTYFTYPPSITTEYEVITFYINQSGLSQLPDGNYTLGRPINTASKYGAGEPAEELLTTIQIIAGAINITYPNFTNQTLPEVSLAFTTQFVVIALLSSAIFVVRRKRTKVY